MIWKEVGEGDKERVLWTSPKRKVQNIHLRENCGPFRIMRKFLTKLCRNGFIDFLPISPLSTLKY